MGVYQDVHDLEDGLESDLEDILIDSRERGQQETTCESRRWHAAPLIGAAREFTHVFVAEIVTQLKERGEDKQFCAPLLLFKPASQVLFGGGRSMLRVKECHSHLFSRCSMSIQYVSLSASFVYET
jgi:hypothetical protein